MSCSKGYYCPSTSISLNTQLPCLAGTYQNETGQTACINCSVGYMCNQDALTSPNLCQAGYICDRSKISYPMIVCPPGYYCLAGTNTQSVNKTFNYYQVRNNS